MPETALLLRVKLLALMLDALIGSLKVTVTAVFTGTPVAPACGDTLVTVGGVVSGATLKVVKLQVNRALVLPAASRTAPAGIVTV